MLGLAAKFTGFPAMVETNSEAWLASVIEKLEMAYEKHEEQLAAAAASEDFWSPDFAWIRPYNVQNGVLQIPIAGLLLNGFPYQYFDIATGYEYIEAAYARGMDDPEVSAIAFVLDSGGGMVAGNFDMVDRMYAGKEKPVYSVVNEHAYSAAYSIASVADKIFVPRTGGVGSIGVVTSHVDMSGYLAKMGVKVTFIHAGKYKVEGNSYNPLSEEALSRIQTRVDRMYSIFVNTVARNRGMDESKVRSTEALTYSAEDAVEIGLADEVMSAQDALGTIMRELHGTQSNLGAETMDQKEQANTQEQGAVDTARKEAATAERERIKGIMSSDQAKGRESLAEHLAYNTQMSVDDALAALAAAPVAQAAPAAAENSQQNAFAQAMGKDNPNVGAEASASDSENAEVSASEQILADWRAATGRRVNK